MATSTCLGMIKYVRTKFDVMLGVMKVEYPTTTQYTKVLGARAKWPDVQPRVSGKVNIVLVTILQ